MSGTPTSADLGTYDSIGISVSDGIANVGLPTFSIDVVAVSTGSVTLNWTPPTLNEDGTPLDDLTGFKIYWGTTPGTYPESVTLDNPGLTSYVVENLPADTYYFVATSLSTSGGESRQSGMAQRTVQ